MAVGGTGIVKWNVEVNGKVVELKLRALHVPSAGVRLLSPQQLLQEHPVPIQIIEVKNHSVRIQFEEGPLECPCNDSNLPVISISTPTQQASDLQALNACVMQESNQNITAAQKELLRWHCKLGHPALPDVQRIMRTGALGHSPLIRAASKVDLNKGLICASFA